MSKLIIPIVLLISLTFFLFFSGNTTAQQRFKAGVIGGLNASQIQNDDVGGYRRLGIQGGLRAITIFTDKIDLFFEILYSQRGQL